MRAYHHSIPADRFLVFSMLGNWRGSQASHSLVSTTVVRPPHALKSPSRSKYHSCVMMMMVMGLIYV